MAFQETSMEVLIQNMVKINRMVNGGENDVVQTDNGPVPSIRKQIKDLNEDISVLILPLLEEAELYLGAQGPQGPAVTPDGTDKSIQFNNFGVMAGSPSVSIDDDDLVLATSATLTVPPANKVKLFARSIAGRMFPAYIGPSGLDSALQSLLARNKIGYWNPPGNATTVPGVFGFTGVTVTGTTTARNVATTNRLTRMRRLGFVSAATAAALAGIRVAAAQFTLGAGGDIGGFTFITRFAFTDAATVSGARAFVGVSSNTGAPTNVEPNTLTNSVGIAQLSTDATRMYICYGGTSAQTAIALSATDFPIVNNVAFELSLFSPPNVSNSITYEVTNLNTGAVATGVLSGTAVQVPNNNVLLTTQIWRTNNATALAVGIDVCSIYVETDQ